MEALEELKRSLREAIHIALPQGTSLGSVERLVEERSRVKQLFNRPPALAEDKKRRAVEAYRSTGRISNPFEMYLLCWSLSGTAGSDIALMDTPILVKKLLDEAKNAQTGGKLSTLAWRGLLFSYLNFDPERNQQGNAGWLQLRIFLSDSFRRLWDTTKVKPDWMQALNENRSLLHDKPAKPYALPYLNGDRDSIYQFIDKLDIPESSWFIRAFLQSLVDAAYGMADTQFKECLDAIISATLKHRQYATASLKGMLLRYSKCDDLSEHVPLRELALEVWGSPKLRQNDPKWSSVPEEVKGMVLKWLLGTDIREFFQILSQDGSADERRLKFWLRYLDSMRDAYYSLGGTARWSPLQRYQDIRKRNKGRISTLRGTTNDNNAFIMHFGAYVVVEFGSTGNACFCFKQDDLPFNLDADAFFGTKRELKNEQHPGCKFRLIHGGTAIWPSWEDQFEYELKKLGILPGAAATKTRERASQASPNSSEATPFSMDEFMKLVRVNSLVWSDHRQRSGVLWVLKAKFTPDVIAQLRAWGFVEAAAGWYKNMV